MANSYTLTRITIELASGSPVATLHGKGYAPESTQPFDAARQIVPTGQPLNHVNLVVQDALTYLTTQFGVTVTLPVPVVTE